MTWATLLHALARGPRPPLPRWRGCVQHHVEIPADAEPAPEPQPVELAQLEGITPTAAAARIRLAARTGRAADLHRPLQLRRQRAPNRSTT